MFRVLVAFSLLVPALSVLGGCADSCDELCNIQSRAYDACMVEWGTSWDDMVDSEGVSYGSAAAYRTGCKQAKKDRIAEEKELGCAGSEDQAACELTLELDILDTCEGDKLAYQSSCTALWQLTVDPGLEDPDYQGDDDSAR